MRFESFVQYSAILRASLNSSALYCVLSKFKSWHGEQLNPAHQREGGAAEDGAKLRGENCLVVYLGVIHEPSQKIRCPARCNGVIYQGMGAREGRLLASDWLLSSNAGL